MDEVKVGIIMGSDSDLPVMKAAGEILDRFAVAYEMTIVSAHRTPDRLCRYAREADGRGLQVIIAGAGGAAHLPGMVAAMTSLPVIGVPVDITPLKGLDSLFSIVQMPKGVPVATVAINNSFNAGMLAARILSLRDDSLKDKLVSYRQEQEDIVLSKAVAMEGKR